MIIRLKYVELHTLYLPILTKRKVNLISSIMGINCLNQLLNIHYYQDIYTKPEDIILYYRTVCQIENLSVNKFLHGIN